MRLLFAIISLVLCAFGASAQQRFVYLTTEEVRIDSVLPRVGHRFALPPDFADSVYSVALLYPEYIEMSPSDIVQYERLSGGSPLPEIPQPEWSVVYERKQPSLNVSVMPLAMRDGQKKWLSSFMLKVEAKAKAGAQAKASRAEADASSVYAEHSLLATGKWAKIRVPSTGVYELTEGVVKQAGFSDLSKVKIYGYGGNLQPERLSAEYLASTDDLREVPQCVLGSRHYFYARGPVSWSTAAEVKRTRNPYSDYGYYFITQGDEAPQTLDEQDFREAYLPTAFELNHALYEKDDFAWYRGGRNLFDSTVLPLDATRSYQLDAGQDGDSGNLFVSVTANATSQVQVALNGDVVGTLKISYSAPYDKAGQASETYQIKDLKAENRVTLKPLSGATVRLDYISLAHDIASPDYDLAKSAPAEYVHNITNQDHHADPQADMVIIIPSSQKLLAEAQRLAAFHAEKDGMRVNIVPADELYNEFSSGTPDANAYRRYLKMLYDRAETEADLPKYLLFFGDCIWDNRLLSPTNLRLDANDYLLCYESENSVNEVACYVTDVWFGCLDEGEGASLAASDLADVAVGRFPVVSAEEAKVMVDKAIAYMENKNAGAWQNTIMFMGDDGNNNLHMKDIDEIARMVESVHPEYVVKKVMWDGYERVVTATGYTYPQVTAIIKQQQEEGALMMNYAGHGSSLQVSHEHVLSRQDFAEFSNQNLPLWITASCDIMPYDNAETTIGENAVLNEKGGAVAFFGTTRTVYANYNKKINRAFTEKVLGSKDAAAVSIGEAHRLAHNYLITGGGDITENKLKYALLGDPALRLNVPKAKIVVDAINGRALSEGEKPKLMAGGKATISGHVEGAAEFSGIISATVRDSKETIVCRMNDTSETKEAFTYEDRTKTLFSGSNLLTDGQFSLTFAVPMDINYSDESGLINLFAASGDQEQTAHGYCDDFIVGGTAADSNNITGPSICCYLNSPSFVNGGEVNSTPYFVAQLTDEDGINVTGSGIGHDLSLIIDGQMSKTYNLNDNFQYDFGSCTSGSTFYSIPELEPGEHSLLFRAWDIFNNSSTSELRFVVSKASTPSIVSLSCTDNPAKSETTFVLTHDRMGSSIDVEIEVLDMSGRLLWRNLDRGFNGPGSYTKKWNLAQASGQQLETGVYLYRARVESDGGTFVSKARKLIVVR